MTAEVNVDELRDEIRTTYAAVVLTPTATFHFHTGRALAARLGDDTAAIGRLPDTRSSPSPGSRMVGDRWGAPDSKALSPIA